MSKLMASPLVKRLLGESFDHKSSGLAACVFNISTLDRSPKHKNLKKISIQGNHNDLQV